MTQGTYTFTISALNGGSVLATQTITMVVGSAPGLKPAFGIWKGSGIVKATIAVSEEYFNALVFEGIETLVRDRDYTAIEGSTIITFKEYYLSKLPNGEYWYIAEFDDFVSDRIILIIDRPVSSYRSDNPDTGDDPYMFVLTNWLAVVSALCLFMLGIYYRLAYSNPKKRR